MEPRAERPLPRKAVFASVSLGANGSLTLLGSLWRKANFVTIESSS